MAAPHRSVRLAERRQDDEKQDDGEAESTGGGDACEYLPQAVHHALPLTALSAGDLGSFPFARVVARRVAGVSRRSLGAEILREK